LSGRDLGAILYHLYPFGGITDGVRWMSRYLLDHNVLALANSHGK
jgi:hypothetical protein